MTSDQFRGSYLWKRARARASRGAGVCAICGGPFPDGVRPRSRWAKSVDHVLPLAALNLSTAEGRRMATDPANLRVAHYGCNSRRGAGGRVAVPVRVDAGAWLQPVWRRSEWW